MPKTIPNVFPKAVIKSIFITSLSKGEINMDADSFTAIGIAAALPKEVKSKIYDDLVHPSAKEIGEIVAIAPEAVNKLIREFPGWAYENGKAYVKIFEQVVMGKVKKIPNEKLVRPSLNTIIPAVQANSYNESEILREMYANLVAKSMDADYHRKVHPAYVEILKQLSPYEALFLKEPKFLLQATPICTVNYQKSSDFKNVQGWNLHPENIIRDEDIGFTVVHYYNPHLFQKYGEYQRMIDNFIRLHLIEIPEDKFLSGKDAYADFYLDDVMKKIHVSLREGYELSHIPGVILPTVLGRDFYKICISES